MKKFEGIHGARGGSRNLCVAHRGAQVAARAFRAMPSPCKRAEAPFPCLICSFTIFSLRRHVAEHVLDAHAGDLDAAVSFYLEGGGVGHGSLATSSWEEAPRSVPLQAGGVCLGQVPGIYF